MEMHRIHVQFRGRVQGVGFRARACSAAARAGVRGWVRNEPDGTVDCVAEGSRAGLDAFLSGLLSDMSRYVESHHVTTESATGEYPDFSVRT